jgi:hypothetical protein
MNWKNVFLGPVAPAWQIKLAKKLYQKIKFLIRKHSENYIGNLKSF